MYIKARCPQLQTSKYKKSQLKIRNLCVQTKKRRGSPRELRTQHYHTYMNIEYGLYYGRESHKNEWDYKSSVLCTFFIEYICIYRKLMLQIKCLQVHNRGPTTDPFRIGVRKKPNSCGHVRIFITGFCGHRQTNRCFF